ncbi:MAG: ATP-binding protein [Bacteroidota bacterium]
MNEENSQIELIFILSGAFVVLLAVVLVLFLVIYQKRIVTQESRLQKLENERQQVLLKATIEGQERERERIAKDLHDGIGSLLSGLSLNLKFQKNKEKSGSKQAGFLSEACDLLDEGIENVRSVSHNLMPPTLENFGLLSAMMECVQPIHKSGILQVSVTTRNEPFRLTREVSLGLLRVFQELIQNTVKHAQATKVKAVLEYHPDFLFLTYHDNGKGFDFDNINTSGIGIKNMQSRIQALNGTFELKKEKDVGFFATMRVPLLSNTEDL